MTEQELNDPLLILRKQLRFRAWHRGTREADLLLGPFADHFLKTCSDQDVYDFAKLLDIEDPDLWDWVVGKTTPPAEENTPPLKALCAYVMERDR